MNKAIRIVMAAAVFVLSGISDSRGSEIPENMREFYLTRLYAIKTQIKLLDSQRSNSAPSKKELLIREKALIEKRLGKNRARPATPVRAARVPDRLSREHINMIAEHKARKYGVPHRLVKAVIKAESDYDIHARSHKGAMGLMQLMPETAKDLGVENPWDAEQNIEGGTKYLALLMREFNGNVRKALIGYNSGPGRVRQNKGVFKETKVYVERVIDYMKKA